MNETLDYIESYFSDTLSAGERQRFEQRIVADAAFAGEVAFYLQARQALQQEVLQQKEKSWPGESETVTTTQPIVAQMQKPSPMRRWMIAAAVVGLIGISLVFLLNRPANAAQLAQQYTDSAFGQLSNLMDASHDSLQQGIAFYNAGKWDEAAKMFDGVYAAHPDTLDALKYSGITALKQKNFEKAINRFQQLTSYTDYYNNPGPFYQAIALLRRNKGEDAKQATALLQQVVDQNLYGHTKATQLLQKLHS